MAGQASALDNIDRFHAQLRSQLEKLQQALRLWQTQELDYESLKEEIAALPEDASASILVKTMESTGCESLSAADFKDLTNADKPGNARSQSQVLGLISRRIDYVSRNAETLTKQIAALEQKLENVEDVRAASAGPTHETGEAVMEIQEDLDDEDQVVGSRVGVPRDAAGELLEVLGKLGVTGDEQATAKDTAKDTAKETASTSVPSDAPATIPASASDQRKAETSASGSKPTAGTTSPLPAQSAIATPSPPQPAAPQSPSPSKAPQPSPTRRKSVTFAPDTKSSPSSSTTPPTATSHAILPPSASTTHTLTNSTLRAQRFHLSPDSPLLNPTSTEPPSASPPNPAAPPESAADAALRAQMLHYTMDENRAIVAQMDLLDDASDDSSYWSDDADEPLDDAASAAASDSDEDEDEHGLSVRRHITPALQREMHDLEARLAAQGLLNAGPAPAVPDAAHVLRVRPDDDGDAATAEPETAPAPSPPGKTVRFAPPPDAAPPEAAAAPQAVAPLAATVVERAPGRAARPDAAILQRDLAMQRREVVHRLVERQGGYLSGEVGEEAEAMAAAAAPAGRKVSRFRAARLQGDG